MPRTTHHAIVMPKRYHAPPITRSSNRIQMTHLRTRGTSVFGQVEDEEKCEQGTSLGYGDQLPSRSKDAPTTRAINPSRVPTICPGQASAINRTTGSYQGAVNRREEVHRYGNALENGLCGK